jgi:hypothetical protein
MGIKVKAGDVFLIPLDENFSVGGILIRITVTLHLIGLHSVC